MIPLGFEVGTGTPVLLPLRHLVITGQTQEAGKTTALEALITRSGLRAVTFVTKRGEGSFTDARRIDPYFREQADWQFVAAILEASRGEKLKFERAWIIRASKGARTLADVQHNVQRALLTAKGLSADVYLTLEAYLEAVVPQIAAVYWAPGLALAPGVNAMDLTGLTVEMQHLVIKSALDWVLARETDTVVVVPEAWKFIPQGRGTPVKLAAEAFIRQAAGLRNYLWLDSQDIAGVEKIILKSVPLWILGVQREANEVKRTLAQIPAGIKRPRPEQIATLGLGQFFACWGTHVLQVYAQPAWMTAETAQAIARGTRAVEDVHAPAQPARPIGHSPRQEEHVTKREADALRQENLELRRRLVALEDRGGISPGPEPTRPAPASSPAPGRAVTVAETFEHEALYQAIKARLLTELPTDPALLRVLTVRPELRVEIERREVTADGASVKGRVARLIAGGFFRDGRTQSATRRELARTGSDVNSGGLSVAIKDLVKDGFLTDDGTAGYHAVEAAAVRIVEA